MALSVHESVNQLVKDNSVDEFLRASDILIKFARNIIQNPNEFKYRRIRLSNPSVQSKLLNTAGGMECLFEMGFQEDGEYLYLHPDTDLEALRSIQNELESERRRLMTTKPNQSTASVPASSSHFRSLQTLSENQPSAISYMESEGKFESRVRDGMRRIMLYENKAIQEKARQIIPVEELTSEARDKLQLNSLSTSKNKKPLDLQDYILLTLLRWFKVSFFKWVDCLPCSYCGGSTNNTGSVQPSQDDQRWGAGRVEAHMCTTCSRVTRFPRYTNAEKLLETRRGRCGEWADCFTLCCRSLGFEARFVMDWTDHVWTEVFSLSQDRWLHCDPCENICDKPLLYESGWGKKLTYVIAVSKDDVQDVSWRYSAKHDELLLRRTMVREKWLVHTLHKLRKEKMLPLPEDRKKILKLRMVRELIAFLSANGQPSESLPGRTTGSLQWRQARGELGAGSVMVDGSGSNFVFTPTMGERESEVIHICYSCVTDKYIRKSSGNEEKHGWQSCVNSAKSVFRKEEFDWKMVYLAREEGSSSSEITWKFDLKGTDLRVSKIEIKAVSTVYEGATVNWRICAGENCFTQSGLLLSDFMTFDLHGSLEVSLTAVLQGGKGEHSWQHSQLFRQSMDDKESFPLEIKLFLN